MSSPAANLSYQGGRGAATRLLLFYCGDIKKNIPSIGENYLHFNKLPYIAYGDMSVVCFHVFKSDVVFSKTCMSTPQAIVAEQPVGSVSVVVSSCQAFAEQELDGNGDGRITVPDVFAYLQNAWAAQRRHNLSFARNNANKGRNLSRPYTLDDVHRGLDRRRTTLLRWRGTAGQAPGGGGRFFPRGLAEKLVAAAG